MVALSEADHIFIAVYYDSQYFLVFPNLKFDSIDWGTDDKEEEEAEGDSSDEEYVPRLCVWYVIIQLLQLLRHVVPMRQLLPNQPSVSPSVCIMLQKTCKVLLFTIKFKVTVDIFSSLCTHSIHDQNESLFPSFSLSEGCLVTQPVC